MAMRVKNGVEPIQSPTDMHRSGSRPKPPKAVAQRASLEARRCMPDHKKAERRLPANTVAFSALFTLWLLCRGVSCQSFIRLIAWHKFGDSLRGSRFSSWSAHLAATAWGQRTRRNNLSSVLPQGAIRRAATPRATNSPRPSSPAGTSFAGVDPALVNPQAVADPALQRNSVLSTHI